MKTISVLQPWVSLIAIGSDEFIAWMLENGYYDIDIKTGAVVNKRRGNRPLSGPINKDGYKAVVLFHSKGIQRNVLVHRVVAIKIFGLENVRGKQVGHRDSNRANNLPYNLWIPSSQKEHFVHDGIMKNLIHGQERCKENWDPCARCGDPNGSPYYKRKTPARIRAERFCYSGKICLRCYHTLTERERRRKRKVVS